MNVGDINIEIQKNPPLSTLRLGEGALAFRKSLVFDVLLLYLLVYIYDSKLPIVLFVG